jgi:hypothetical protein
MRVCFVVGNTDVTIACARVITRPMQGGQGPYSHLLTPMLDRGRERERERGLSNCIVMQVDDRKLNLLFLEQLDYAYIRVQPTSV